jgi:hypothetical protein
MQHADGARVEWNDVAEQWEVHILTGADIVKFPIVRKLEESGEAALKHQAVAKARDEGYELNPDQVALEESEDHFS